VYGKPRPANRSGRVNRRSCQIVDVPGKKKAASEVDAALPLQRHLDEPADGFRTEGKSVTKREKLLRSIRDKINAAPNLYGINKVGIALVREAAASLEAEGRPIETLRGKEEIVAKRIIRLNPDKVAI